MRRFLSIALMLMYAISVSGVLSSVHACCSGNMVLMMCDADVPCCSEEKEEPMDDECGCPEELSDFSGIDIVQFVVAPNSLEELAHDKSLDKVNLCSSNIEVIEAQKSILWSSDSSPPIEYGSIRILFCSLLFYH